jgi:putative ABC transport system substrate-binding protein
MVGMAIWPVAARAQQPERMRRVGALMAYAANDPQVQERNAAFLQRLQQLGWTVGQNLQIDYSWAGGNEEDTRKYAAELVALAPDVIFAPGSAAVGPLRRVTRIVPIVFTNIVDPVSAILRDPAISAGLGLWAAIQSVSPAFATEVTPGHGRCRRD